MIIEPSDKVPYHFPGITILVPKQKEFDIVAVDKGTLIPDKIPWKTDSFTLIRLIGNIVLIKKADYDQGKVNIVKTFDPPVEIRVGYSSFDVIQSRGDPQKLKLAYWDGDRWVILNNKSHEYQILPPSTAQVAEAKIWSWAGDPPLAWGK